MIISVASGKGGTGKTSFAVALAQAIDKPVTLKDCDVEEPNCSFFFKDGNKTYASFSVPVPVIDETKCIGCGKCSAVCEFNAITVIAGKAMIFPELCHSCGGCILACQSDALAEDPFVIGEISQSKQGLVTLVEGRLKIGHAMSPPLIKGVKAVETNNPITIIDAPPGTSCPFVTTVKGSDFTILVTEPTPFGLHDLTLAVATIRTLGVPFGVVVNRIDSIENNVTEYCQREGIALLLQIPESMEVAQAYSRGISFLHATTIPFITERVRDVYRKIVMLTGAAS